MNVDDAYSRGEQCGYDRGYDEGHDVGWREGYDSAMEDFKQHLLAMLEDLNV